MGAYLNKPVVDKEHEEGQNSKLRFACTSMQGWRINQEDAHNCILDVHEEVAKYTSAHFPGFLKERNIWTTEDIERAIQDVFVDFDDQIRSKNAVKELTKIANDGKEENSDSEDERDRLDTINESSLSLEEVLNRMGYARRFVKENVSAISALKSPSSSEESEEGDSMEDHGSVEDKNVEAEKKPSKRSNKSPIQSSPKKVKTVDENGKAKEVDKKPTEEETNGDSNKAEEPKNEDPSSESTADTNSADIPADPEPKKVNLNFKKKQSAYPEYKEVKPANTGVSKELDIAPDDDSDDEDFAANGEVEDEESDEVSGEEESEGEEDDEIDNQIMFGQRDSTPGEDSGTTACVCLMSNEKIIVANAGDSRAVLCRNGKALDLSIDHKPEDEIEKNRITKAGGVIDDGRVNGGLNLSRALGDHCYKKNKDLPLREQMISALPDVKIECLLPDDEFLVVACDGIWNSMESQQVVDFVRERLSQGKTCKEICDALCDNCLADSTRGDGTGCDNMTTTSSSSSSDVTMDAIAAIQHLTSDLHRKFAAHHGLKLEDFDSGYSTSSNSNSSSQSNDQECGESSGAKVIDFRGHKVAAFDVVGKEMICLPQVYELFLKNMVGGLHTVYTKLRRLDITPLICNVEQVRALRSLGAIQPGVNRCKLIKTTDFDKLYEDCTNTCTRPGRPSKRGAFDDYYATLKKEKIEEGRELNNVSSSCQNMFGQLLPQITTQQIFMQHLVALASAQQNQNFETSDENDDDSPRRSAENEEIGTPLNLSKANQSEMLDSDSMESMRKEDSSPNNSMSDRGGSNSASTGGSNRESSGGDESLVAKVISLIEIASEQFKHERQELWRERNEIHTLREKLPSNNPRRTQPPGSVRAPNSEMRSLLPKKQATTKRIDF
ncbi:unnamed protein product [Caenorhabditis auriculariae]|uniref:PPM-type phosphatase domain-containing protein n=1 Tax=Caenorhabditis auriculariae TaxID=2777116 RepID=A0A8S1HZW1_9PELO|nr:unnamed protein product [Caenorhabditis auriculariae]